MRISRVARVSCLAALAAAREALLLLSATVGGPMEREPAPHRRRERLPRAGRLRSARDFERVRRRGRRQAGALLSLGYARRPEAEAGALPRVGFSVSRRVGGAVARNHVKRWLRESVRRFYADLAPGWDIMFTARGGAADAGYNALDAEARELVRKARLWRPGPVEDRGL